MEQEQQVKPKRKQRVKPALVSVLDVAETFDVGNSKEKDFDLDLDAARFQGKKGQAGTRTKMNGGGDEPWFTIRRPSGGCACNAG